MSKKGISWNKDSIPKFFHQIFTPQFTMRLWASCIILVEKRVSIMFSCYMLGAVGLDGIYAVLRVPWKRARNNDRGDYRCVRKCLSWPVVVFNITLWLAEERWHVTDFRLSFWNHGACLTQVERPKSWSRRGWYCLSYISDFKGKFQEFHSRAI